MRYVRAKVAEDEERLSYRQYIANAQMAIAENTARMVGGSHMTVAWWEHYNRKVELRTGDEIVADVMREAGLCFRKDRSSNQEKERR